MGVAVYLGQIVDQIVSMITCFFFIITISCEAGKFEKKID